MTVPFTFSASWLPEVRGPPGETPRNTVSCQSGKNGGPREASKEMGETRILAGTRAGTGDINLSTETLSGL